MVARESQPAIEGKAQPKLGLARLSARGIEVLGDFISDCMPPAIKERYEVELRQTLLTRDPEQARVNIEDVAHSAVPEERLIACQIVPYFAAQELEPGFALWLELIRDGDQYVHEAAQQALVNTLGVLDLDPEGVVSVIEAYYQRQANPPAPPSGETS